MEQASQKAIVKKTRAQNIELLQLCLGHMHAGQDVQITFRTSKQRDLSGYWVWSLTELRHLQVSVNKVREDKKGPAWAEYHKQIAHRRWRWHDIEKLAEKIRAGRMTAVRP
jgi:hypothetical protein